MSTPKKKKKTSPGEIPSGCGKKCVLKNLWPWLETAARFGIGSPGSGW